MALAPGEIPAEARGAVTKAMAAMAATPAVAATVSLRPKGPGAGTTPAEIVAVADAATDRSDRVDRDRTSTR